MRISATLLALALLGPIAAAATETKSDGAWSADLLNHILRTDVPKAAAEQPALSEMVLRTYQLTHLRIGEAGKSQSVLGILPKLLPGGSAVNPDVAANSLHVLTTPAAHKAIWEYLSAVDVAEPAAKPAAGEIPADVKAALAKLAQTAEQSPALVEAVNALKRDVAHDLAARETDQRQHTTRLIAALVGFGLVAFLSIAWMLRRRPVAPIEPLPSAALAVGPDQLATALTPVHDKMRGEVLGLLNEVAIKLQAQHNEQQKLVREQQQRLEDARLALADERRQFISEAGSMVVQAVERVDATTAKLSKQQDKVAELVEELQATVRELDATKDDLRNREIELEQERSKIAALSLLLEEGGVVPPCNGFSGAPGHNGRGLGHGEGAVTSIASVARPEAILTCPTKDQSMPTVGLSPSRPVTSCQPAPRFQFLPPDHPET